MWAPNGSQVVYKRHMVILRWLVFFFFGWPFCLATHIVHSHINLIPTHNGHFDLLLPFAKMVPCIRCLQPIELHRCNPLKLHQHHSCGMFSLPRWHGPMFSRMLPSPYPKTPSSPVKRCHTHHCVYAVFCLKWCDQCRLALSKSPVSKSPFDNCLWSPPSSRIFKGNCMEKALGAKAPVFGVYLLYTFIPIFRTLEVFFFCQLFDFTQPTRNGI